MYPEAQPAAPTLKTASCGCDRPPRRICDVCYSPTQVFLACSNACLARHLAAEHPHAPVGAGERARDYAAQVNARFPYTSDLYAAHRARLSRLIDGLPQGAEICVFGAGNCSDLDLGELTARFREVHLVDLDGAALERAYERQGAAIRSRLHLHPDVELSGLVSEIDAWGDGFPEPAQLMPAAVRAAHGILRQVGRTFPAVVSACVLSQLPVPFHRSWILPRSGWGNLLAALNAVHLATLARSTSPGGAGVLVFDAASSKDTAEILEKRSANADALSEFVARATASGALNLRPEPASLRDQMLSPGLRSLVQSAELSQPWLWDLGDATQLVYALEFRRPVA